MKLIIAGSRTLNVHPEFINETIQVAMQSLKIDYPTEIVWGGASGIDECALDFAAWALLPDKLFKYESFFGLAGGPIRNKKMAEYADALLLIWDGESRGSKNMLNEMTKLNKPVYQVILKGIKNE